MAEFQKRHQWWIPHVPLVDMRVNGMSGNLYFQSGDADAVVLTMDRTMMERLRDSIDAALAKTPPTKRHP